MAHNYLGIDPSTVASGYGVINSNGELLDWGVIRPNKKKLNEPQQAAFQYNAFKELIEKYDIKGLATEDQHSGPNPDTLKKLSRVSGYLMLLAGQYDLPFELYHPSSWRKISLGKGNAKKEDSVFWVKDKYELLLDVKKHNDIAEGIGICYAGMIHFNEQLKQNDEAIDMTGGLQNENL